MAKNNNKKPAQEVEFASEAAVPNKQSQQQANTQTQNQSQNQ